MFQKRSVYQVTSVSNWIFLLLLLLSSKIATQEIKKNWGEDGANWICRDKVQTSSLFIIKL